MLNAFSVLDAQAREDLRYTLPSPQKCKCCLSYRLLHLFLWQTYAMARRARDTVTASVRQPMARGELDLVQLDLHCAAFVGRTWSR